MRPWTRILRSAAWTGIAFFFLGIGLAVFLYPGGSRFDDQYGRFSLNGNFLCDLYATVAYNRVPHSGRPHALFGTYSLAAALLLFWNLIPALFPRGSRLAPFVRGFGTAAMAVSFLIATSWHDQSILIAVPLGLVAFVLSVRGLELGGHRGLARLGAVSLALCFLNYLFLVAQIWPRSHPGLQKITLAVFLAWVLATMRSLPRSKTTAAE